MKAKSAVLAILMAALAGTVQADEAPKLASGLLMKQEGRLVFAPCRDRSYALMEDVSANSGVTSALKDIGLEAGKKLYVELFAVMEGAVLKASGLNFARADGRCQPPGSQDEAWRAAGKDWAMAAGGDQILVKGPGKQEFSFPYVSFKADSGSVTHETAQDGRKLTLRFDRGNCAIPGGDALTGWKATVSVDGRRLQGCAWQR